MVPVDLDETNWVYVLGTPIWADGIAPLVKGPRWRRRRRPKKMRISLLFPSQSGLWTVGGCGHRHRKKRGKMPVQDAWSMWRYDVTIVS